MSKTVFSIEKNTNTIKVKTIGEDSDLIHALTIAFVEDLYLNNGKRTEIVLKALKLASAVKKRNKSVPWGISLRK